MHDLVGGSEGREPAEGWCADSPVGLSAVWRIGQIASPTPTRTVLFAGHFRFSCNGVERFSEFDWTSRTRCELKLAGFLQLARRELEPSIDMSAPAGPACFHSAAEGCLNSCILFPASHPLPSAR